MISGCSVVVVVVVDVVDVGVDSDSLDLVLSTHEMASLGLGSHTLKRLSNASGMVDERVLERLCMSKRMSRHSAEQSTDPVGTFTSHQNPSNVL